MVYTDDVVEEGKDVLKRAQDELEKKADEAEDSSKGFFESLGDKVKNYYGKAVEKGKEAAKATADAVASTYNNLKEKASDLIDSSEKKTTEKLP